MILYYAPEMLASKYLSMVIEHSTQSSAELQMASLFLMASWRGSLETGISFCACYVGKQISKFVWIWPVVSVISTLGTHREVSKPFQLSSLFKDCKTKSQMRKQPKPGNENAFVKLRLLFPPFLVISDESQQHTFSTQQSEGEKSHIFHVKVGRPEPSTAIQSSNPNAQETGERGSQY